MPKGIGMTQRIRLGVQQPDLKEAEVERLDAALDIAEGECSHGVHGPWCREWKKLVASRDVLAEALRELLETASDLLSYAKPEWGWKYGEEWDAEIAKAAAALAELGGGEGGW